MSFDLSEQKPFMKNENKNEKLYERRNRVRLSSELQTFTSQKVFFCAKFHFP